MISMKSHAIQRTKQYLIDLMGSAFFSGKIHWDSVDTFNSLPLVWSDQDQDEDNFWRREIRGCLLVHRQHFYGCRLSICAESGNSDRACYRLSPLKVPVKLDDANRIVFPMKQKFDVSLADLNMGADDHSAYSYYHAFADSQEKYPQGSAFHILKFILDTDIVVAYAAGLFDDLIYEKTTQIPYVGDLHYVPVFEVGEKNGN